MFDVARQTCTAFRLPSDEAVRATRAPLASVRDGVAKLHERGLVSVAVCIDEEATSPFGQPGSFPICVLSNLAPWFSRRARFACHEIG